MTFALTLLFMLMVFWRPQDWLFTWMYGWPLLDVIVSAALLSLTLEVNEGRVRFPRGPVPFLAAGLYLSTLMSHVAHTYFAGIMMTLTDSFKPCFFMLLLFVVIDRVERARAVAAMFAAMGCFMAVHAILQQQTGFGFANTAPMQVYTEAKGFYTRSLFFGIFEDPNDLAQMLVVAMPFVLAVPRRFSIFKLMLCAGAITLLYYGFASTDSRGGLVALVAVAGCFLSLLLPIRWMPVVLGLGLIGALVVCGAVPGLVIDMSAQERVVFWGLANQAFKANPIFGLGYGMFWQVAKSRAAHNAFVGCYTELGIFGYWFWFGLLLLGIANCWRARVALRGQATAQLRYLRRLSGVSIVGAVGFMASAYFLSRAFVFPYFFMLALLNAIPVIAQRLLGAEKLPLPTLNMKLVGMLTAGAIGSILYIYISILLLNKAIFGT